MNLKKIKNIFKFFFNNLNSTVLIIFYLNIFSIGVYQFYFFFDLESSEKVDSTPKNRYKLESHHKYKWAKKYFEDEQNLKAEYIPIIGFKEKKFKSETINTDKDGYRISRNNSIDKPDIIFLGGSTMFGYGSNDSNTIPSLISELLNDSLKVRNLGNGAHTSTQNLLKFYDQILKKVTPKYLICYEGVNETTNLKINLGSTLIHHYGNYFRNQLNIDHQYENSLNIKTLFNNYISQIEEIIFLGLRKMGFIPYKKIEEVYNFDDISIERASTIFLENWKLIAHISIEKGIRPSFFLQPYITSNNHKTDYLTGIETFEKRYSKVLKKIYSKILEKINNDVEYNLIKDNFFDLSKSLDNKNAYFYDYCHINPSANKKISMLMINKIFK